MSLGRCTVYATVAPSGREASRSAVAPGATTASTSRSATASETGS